MISLICFAGFQSGQSVMLGNCSETCSCAAGVFTCKNSQCKEGQKCGLKNGVMDCYSTGKKTLIIMQPNRYGFVLVHLDVELWTLLMFLF